MDLLTLNAQNQPAKLIENWDSLLWAERYSQLGDFQLVTGRISEFMNLLPEGTRVTLRETNQVMIVENHLIERKKNEAAKLTITGRSFASILDRRAAIQSVDMLTSSNPWVVNMRTPSDLAYYLINYVCVAGSIDPQDVFPSTMVQFPAPSDYGASAGPIKEFDVPRGNLLDTVIQLIEQEAPIDTTTDPDTPAVVPRGIRAVRPSGTSTAIQVQIYQGSDKTSTVYFDATRDLLDDGNYLFSKVGSANVAYGVGAGMSAMMYEGASEPSGLDRRVILVDASDSSVNSPEVLQNYMSQSLSGARETAMFDGSINQDLSPYVFGVDYGLGDIVRVVGDYGLDERARVTEYIRSEDASGFKSYPTLTTIVE